MSDYDQAREYMWREPHPTEVPLTAMTPEALVILVNRLDGELAAERAKNADLLTALESLRDPKTWKVGRASAADQYQGLPPAVRIVDAALAKAARGEKYRCADASCGHCAGCYEAMRAEFNDAQDALEAERAKVRELEKENASLLNAFPEYGKTGNELREERARTDAEKKTNSELLEVLSEIEVQLSMNFSAPREIVMRGVAAKARAALAKAGAK